MVYFVLLTGQTTASSQRKNNNPLKTVTFWPKFGSAIQKKGGKKPFGRKGQVVLANMAQKHTIILKVNNFYKTSGMYNMLMCRHMHSCLILSAHITS